MTRTSALRLSILLSLGIVPIACSGKTLSNGDDDEDGGGVSNVGGTGTDGGTTGKAGSPSTAGAAGAAGGTTGRGCTDGKLDAITGLLWCEEGYQARPAAKECALPDGGAGGVGGEPSLPRANGSLPCKDDAECQGFELGFCKADEEGFGGASSFCNSGCVNDQDCGGGRICLCSADSTHGGTCVPGKCHTNAECGAGYVCATYAVPCGPEGFACTKAQDECPSAECNANSCTFEVNRRVCDDSVCGRPFLVEQQARVAPVGPHAAWSDHFTPRVAHLTAAERDALAAHWTRLGQMEHASIAAFARFQLQLLALGAPAQLVQACNQALVDETAHTQLCFGLASAYAGKTIGPGPLDVSHSLDVSSLEDIVDLVILEGCYGETSAALEALEAADAATDPVIRGAYARIAEDEQRHAELAFRFVKWALERDDEDVRRRIIVALPHAPAGVRDVAVPCLQALLNHRGRGVHRPTNVGDAVVLALAAQSIEERILFS